MRSIVLQRLHPLYSTVHFRLSQFPDIASYIQRRERSANSDREDVTIKLAETDDFHQIVSTLDICVVAYKHGKIVHVRWAALSPLPAWGRYTVHLRSDEAYTYDSYTVPAFRRQDISSKTRVFLLRYLQQQGIRCTYSDTRLDNPNTQHGWEKYIREGHVRLLGLVTVTTRLGMTRCRFTAYTPDMRPLIARLFHTPLRQVRVAS
jgi:hypothetical protein